MKERAYARRYACVVATRELYVQRCVFPLPVKELPFLVLCFKDDVLANDVRLMSQDCVLSKVRCPFHAVNDLRLRTQRRISVGIGIHARVLQRDPLIVASLRNYRQVNCFARLSSVMYRTIKDGSVV